MDAKVESSSLPRDHMANERTHLAWLRTAANVMVVGLAIARFADNGSITVASVLAGGLLIAIGTAGVVYGTLRYRAVNRELDAGEFVTGGLPNGPTWAALLLVAGMVAALVVLLVAT